MARCRVGNEVKFQWPFSEVSSTHIVRGKQERPQITLF